MGCLVFIGNVFPRWLFLITGWPLCRPKVEAARPYCSILELIFFTGGHRFELRVIALGPHTNSMRPIACKVKVNIVLRPSRLMLERDGSSLNRLRIPKSEGF